MSKKHEMLQKLQEVIESLEGLDKESKDANIQALCKGVVCLSYHVHDHWLNQQDLLEQIRALRGEVAELRALVQGGP